MDLVADMSAISTRTIAAFDVGTGNTTPETKAALRGALEQAGVTFINERERGAKLTTRR